MFKLRTSSCVGEGALRARTSRAARFTLGVPGATPLALAGLLLFAGCGGVVSGSGRAAEDQRTVGAWRTLDVGSGIHATVTRGAPAVTLTGDDNLLPLIETVVEGETLHVRLRSDLVAWNHLELTAQVQGEVLEGVHASGAATVDGDATTTRTAPFPVEASGSSRVTLGALDASEVLVTASGASTVTLEGLAERLTVRASGSSTVDTRALPVDHANVDASGASTLELTARAKVQGSLSGSSRLELGGGASTDVAASGGSTIATR